MTNRKKKKQDQIKLITTYNKIRIERETLATKVSVVDEEKQELLAAALNKIADHIAKKLKKINARKAILAQKMESILSEVYEYDPDMASDMALGKPVELTPTLVEPLPNTPEQSTDEHNTTE